MATSRIPSTIDKLVSRFDTATASDVTVYDGPKITGEIPIKSVHIGYDGDVNGDYIGANATQEWAGLGAKKREERFVVPCCVIALVGDGAVKTARDRAFTILGDIEDDLRTDPSIGLGPGSAENNPVFIAEMSSPLFYQEPDEIAGMQARIRFDVAVRTRI